MTQSSGTTNNVHFTWRLSSLFIFLLATSTFALGALFVNFPQRTEEAPGNSSITTPDSHSIEKVDDQRNMNDWLDLLFKGLFSPALLITAVAAINQRVTQEMEYELKLIRMGDDRRIEAESERNYQEFMQKYAGEIEALQADITPYIRDRDERQKISEHFSRIQELFTIHGQQKDACRKAGKWMESENNRQELLDFILSHVDSIQVLDSHSEEFRQNLESCFDWLHTSFKKSRPLPFNIHNCASALLKGAVCLETYNLALDSIANFEVFQNIFGSPNHLSKYLHVWIDWLKNKIKDGIDNRARTLQQSEDFSIGNIEMPVTHQTEVPIP
jgi:hypothetical protein